MSASALVVFALTTLALKAADLIGGVVVIWPVEGVILALTLGPMRQRPWLTLAVCRTSALAAGVAAGFPVALCAETNLVNTACTGLLIYWARRHLGPGWFSDSTSLIRLIFAAFVSSVAMSALHATLLCDARTWYGFFRAEVSAAISGLAVMAPLVGVFTRSDLLARIQWRRLPRSCATVCTYSVGVLLVFLQARTSLLYLIPLGLMLLAYVEDLTAVAIAVSITAVIALFATLDRFGPFQMVVDPDIRVRSLQTFLVVITATSLPIAALMAEHARLKRNLIKSRADAEAANQAKSAFLATISHEIRTPLNGVLGMAQALAAEQLTPAQHDLVEVVRNSGSSLLALLNDVLDISKIEAGKIDIEIIDFDLQHLIETTLQNYAALADAKQVALRLETVDCAGLYRGDPTRIRQILGNLISNALKFTPAGEVAVRAAVGPQGLTLSVTDSGIGIAPEKLRKLFSKYAQAEESTTRRFGGTGLGLAICRELAELMGGRIEVASEIGVGSTFTLQLPLEPAATAESEPEAPAPEAVQGDLAALRVLAAEDNSTNRLVLKTLLHVVGVAVTLVENGAEAVDAWETGDWDLILMDVQMPVLDGPGAARAIRAKEAARGRPRTPIIALTADVMAHQVDGYLAEGMDGHLAKPIDAAALFSALACANSNKAQTSPPSAAASFTADDMRSRRANA
jgi:signal transduction histidine kinase/AmiR/NasT family two-component response regulator